MENFLIVLFKNKIKKRIINKYVTFEKCDLSYQNLIKKSDKVIFPKIVENGYPCKFEIALISKNKSNTEQVYKKDNLGRNIKVKLDNEGMSFIKMNEYNEEEKLFDLQEKVKIEIKELIEKYIGNTGIILVSSLHNKIVIQDDEKVFLFSLKNDIESHRFLDCLQNHMIKSKKTNVILVKDYSVAQKKYLINLLEKKGIDKKILYRKFTTYPRSK